MKHVRYLTRETRKSTRQMKYAGIRVHDTCNLVDSNEGHLTLIRKEIIKGRYFIISIFEFTSVFICVITTYICMSTIDVILTIV